MKRLKRVKLTKREEAQLKRVWFVLSHCNWTEKEHLSILKRLLEKRNK